MKIIPLCLLLFLAPDLCASEIKKLEDYYAKGRAFRLAGRHQDAVNHWVKYLELARRLDPPGKRIEEVKAYLEEDKVLVPRPIKIEPASVPVSVPEKQKAASKPPRRNKDQSLSIQLLQKAEKAEFAGRYEESKRLIQLALQREPDNAALQKKAQELDRLLE